MVAEQGINVPFYTPNRTNNLQQGVGWSPDPLLPLPGTAGAAFVCLSDRTLAVAPLPTSCSSSYPLAVQGNSPASLPTPGQHRSIHTAATPAAC
jgi:hypothetical protein